MIFSALHTKNILTFIDNVVNQENINEKCKLCMSIYTRQKVFILIQKNKIQFIVHLSIKRYKQILTGTCNIFENFYTPVNKHRYYFQNTSKVHEYVFSHVIFCYHFD